MDSRHYMAQVQQGYPCQNCGKIFFGAPVVKKTRGDEGKQGEKVASSGLKSHGPRFVYESDTNVTVFNIFGERFEETPTGYWWLFFWFRDIDFDRNYVRPVLSTRFHYGR